MENNRKTFLRHCKDFFSAEDIDFSLIPHAYVYNNDKIGTFGILKCNISLYILLWKQRRIYRNIFTISHLKSFWILIFHDINSLLLFYKSYDKWFPKAEEIRKITSGKVKPFLLKAKRECRNDMKMFA